MTDSDAAREIADFIGAGENGRAETAELRVDRAATQALAGDPSLAFDYIVGALDTIATAAGQSAGRLRAEADLREELARLAEVAASLARSLTRGAP